MKELSTLDMLIKIREVGEKTGEFIGLDKIEEEYKEIMKVAEIFNNNVKTVYNQLKEDGVIIEK